DEIRVFSVLYDSLLEVFKVLVGNTVPDSIGSDFERMIKNTTEYRIEDFNLTADEVAYWPTAEQRERLKDKIYQPTTVKLADDTEVSFTPVVIEPLSIMKAILENSILPVELATTKIFHLSGAKGFMNNFIGEEE
ncbi:MAG: hypothetical protein K2F99_08520, partial [Muribaculaceae bacterium]|nr:hypothetical protein [Muribaculaceae bacterium]